MPALDHPLTPAECVEIALARSGQIAEAEAKVQGFRAQLAEVSANYGPRLQAMAYVAPMFTVEGGVGGYTNKYGPSDWGPYVHLESLLSLPIYTFGRVEAGERAAQARVKVEEARVRLAEGMLAREVRSYYHLVVYARSLQPALGFARKLLDEAQQTAQAQYEAGQGITQVDLGRLAYGDAELSRMSRIAQDGEALALEALKHTMGLPADAPLALAWARLPAPEATPSLPDVLQVAASGRPEWTMLSKGREAALSLAEAERLANVPALFLAGQLSVDWAPTRDDADNPYVWDPFNRVFGGVAIGVQWDLQPLRAAARARVAEALAAEVEGIATFARTGIPLEVRRAHQDLVRHAALVGTARGGVKATRRWLTFASAAYQSGTGDAKDILEGLVAWLSAKRTYMDHLRGYHDARAELARATGRSRTLSEE